MSLTEILKERVDTWMRVGHFPLLELFVARNGKPFEVSDSVVRMGPEKECFKNATQAAFASMDLDYVEGFVASRKFLWPIHHAWVTLDGSRALDPTLRDPREFYYLGVQFDNDSLRAESVRNGVYGMLDTGTGLNADLMFRLDPELRKMYDEYRSTRQPRRAVT